jgi:hypothetical protein
VSAEWVRVSLRAWAPDRSVGTEFLELLRFRPEDGLKVELGDEPGEACRVYLVDEEAATHADAVEPAEAFAGAIKSALLAGAEWMRSRPEGVFTACRARGINTDVFIGSWIDQDQFDLGLPASFLLACGQAGLGITIVTND